MKIMIKILIIPLFLIGYIFYIILSVIKFLAKVIFDIFEKKCNKDVSEIVKLIYYSEEWPDLVAFTLYYDEKLLPSTIKKDETDIKVSKDVFDKIRKSINDNKIISKKTYILNFQIESFKNYYLDFFSCDSGPTTQRLTLYFSDGSKKSLIGYSKELKEFRNLLEEVLPKELFLGL